MIRMQAITLFPEMFAPMHSSIMGRAQKAGLLQFETLQLRDFAINDYGQVDDSPYGGEPGMVLRPEPLAQAIQSTEVREHKGKVIHLCADGQTLSHSMAEQLSTEEHLVFVCGHYKGIDQRIRDRYVDLEISIGDYVVSGGELPAMVVMDAIVRLIPGVLGQKESADTDSHAQGTLGWPVYTRPEIFEGERVPDILLSGHHQRIAAWQKEQALLRTAQRRPDLLKKIKLSSADQDLLQNYY